MQKATHHLGGMLSDMITSVESVTSGTASFGALVSSATTCRHTRHNDGDASRGLVVLNVNHVETEGQAPIHALGMHRLIVRQRAGQEDERCCVKLEQHSV